MPDERVAAAAIAVLETLGDLMAGAPGGGGLVAGELAILTGIYGRELDVALDELVERGAIVRHRSARSPGAAIVRYTLANPEPQEDPNL